MVYMYAKGSNKVKMPGADDKEMAMVSEEKWENIVEKDSFIRLELNRNFSGIVEELCESWRKRIDRSFGMTSLLAENFLKYVYVDGIILFYCQTI